MSSNKSNFLDNSKDINTRFESYSYIPKSNIAPIFKVLNLGILPSKEASVLGIAIFIRSPIFKSKSFAKASPIIISSKSINDNFLVIIFSYK